MAYPPAPIPSGYPPAPIPPAPIPPRVVGISPLGRTLTGLAGAVGTVAKNKIDEQDPTSTLGQAAQGATLAGTGAAEGFGYAGALNPLLAPVGAVIGAVNAPFQNIARRIADKRYQDIIDEQKLKHAQSYLRVMESPENVAYRRAKNKARDEALAAKNAQNLTANYAFPQSDPSLTPPQNSAVDEPLPQAPPPFPMASLQNHQAPVNQAPVNQAPVNQAPVNQAPVNQAPVNQAPVNQAPVNQAPVNQAPVNQEAKEDLIKNWSKYHGVGNKYNDKSSADRAMLTAMQEAQKNGKSVRAVANGALSTEGRRAAGKLIPYSKNPNSIYAKGGR